MLRECVNIYFENIDFNITNDCSIFECMLDLNNCSIVAAKYYDPVTRVTCDHSEMNLPAKIASENIYCQLIDRQRLSGRGDFELVFRSLSNQAVKEALLVLFTSGANIMLFGGKNAGKTRMMLEILDELHRNCPSPDEMRDQIIENLINIVNGASKVQGIFRALEILKTILLTSGHTYNTSNLLASLTIEERQEFHRIWSMLHSDWKGIWSDTTRNYVKNQSVSYVMTSLRGLVGARSLRQWLEREMASETPHVLETSRFTYGVVFLDDLHYLSLTSGGGNAGSNAQNEILSSFSSTSTASKNNSNSQANNSPASSNPWSTINPLLVFKNNCLDRQEELLRGLTHHYNLFNIKRNTAVRGMTSIGYHQGSTDASFKLQDEQPPILHREFVSDLRIQMPQVDNYIMQRVGLVAAVTGHQQDFLSGGPDHPNHRWMNKIIGNFASISLPTFTVNELHACFVTGSLTTMRSSVPDTSVIDILKNEILELSKMTLHTCLKTTSSFDLNLTTSLERTLRGMNLLDLSLVSKFCLSLQFGSVHIVNPGGLLQLYAHEWKRFFLDSLPDGAQRDRLIFLLHEQLDSIQEKAWVVKRQFIEELKEDLAASVDKVWTNTSLLFDESTTESSSELKVDENTAGISEFKPDITVKIDKPNDIEHDNIPSDSRVHSNKSYLPLEVDYTSTDKFMRSGAWNSETDSYHPLATTEEILSNTAQSAGAGELVCEQRVIQLHGLLKSTEIQQLLFPAAISLLLRLVRLLTVLSKHVLVTGYPGSSKSTAVLLAAKIARYEPRYFQVKNSQISSSTGTDGTSSVKAQQCFNLKQFIKSVVLQAAGFSEAVTVSEYSSLLLPNGSLLLPGQVYYEKRDTTSSVATGSDSRYLMVIDQVQQLSIDDRRVLLHILEYQDPSILFDAAEIQGN